MPITDKYFIEKMLCNQYDMVLSVLRSFYFNALYQSCHLMFLMKLIFYDYIARNIVQKDI